MSRFTILWFIVRAGHRAYRDERLDAEPSVPSPFSSHSAYVVEYWSFEKEPRERWMELVESFLSEFQSMLAPLGFPLERRSDRIGNLMISGAEDDISCDLKATGDGRLLLNVDVDDLSPDAYTAAVWAGHSGDVVVRRQVPILQNETTIDLESDVDHIGFAIYRNVDGQCIDLSDGYLLMEINFAMSIGGGPTLQLHDHRSSTVDRVRLWGNAQNKFNVEKPSPQQDKEIRRLVLARSGQERIESARRENSIERFRPNQLNEAVDYFLSLVRRLRYQDGPIYLADPYFMRLEAEDAGRRLFLGMTEAMGGQPLRVLCAPQRMKQPWWTSYPEVLTGRITVRAFTTLSGDRRVFHDRYLIAGDEEILITNSLNGWRTGGVTFVSLPAGVYRGEAEELWQMEVGQTKNSIHVMEIN